MYFKNITINNYKILQNDISVSFERATKQRNVPDSFLETDNKDLNKMQLLNKVSLLGTTAIGKTTFFGAIANIRKISNVKYEYLKKYRLNLVEELSDNIIENITSIKDTKYEIGLTDGKYDCVYEMKGFNEKISFFAPKHTKEYYVTSKTISEILGNNELLFNDITYEMILDLINRIDKTDRNFETTSLLNFVNVDFSFLRGKYKIDIDNYLIDNFNFSLLSNIYRAFNGVHFLNYKNLHFSGTTDAEYKFNRKLILENLYDYPALFEEISIFIKSFNPQIRDFEIKKIDGEIKVIIHKTVDFFEEGSRGLIKMFTLLAFMKFFDKLKTSLILIDGIDISLPSALVYKLLKFPFWKEHQVLFTMYNTSIYFKQFNLFRTDQIQFMRFKKIGSLDREIIRLCDFEGSEKYIRNNKLNDAFFKNEFELAPWTLDMVNDFYND